MKFSDELKDRMEQKEKTPKEELAEEFNKVASKSLRNFMKDMDNGTIQMDDTADMMRLFQIYMQVNDLGNGEEGTGALPAMTSTQRDDMRELVDTHEEEDEEGETTEYVDLDMLASMDEEEVEEMSKKREKQMNNQNVEEG